MRHIIPISGKDSLATALVQNAIDGSLDYEYVFNPTGSELPEVFIWLDKVETHFQKPIVRVGRSLDDIIKENNYFLPSQRSRYCTRQAKIEPFIKWINKDQCHVYYGIRSDENRDGFNNQMSKNIIPCYPLIPLGIDLNGVYSIINANNLKPPAFFWKELYDKVILKLGFDPKDLIPEWMFDHLFSWRSRANCYYCFNQRYYEWVGLLIHHPELFWKSEGMERLGSEGFKRNPKIIDECQYQIFSDEIIEAITYDEKEGYFTWSSNNKSLSEIAKQARYILNKRAADVAKTINTFLESKLFEDNETQIDVLDIKSCGLFCGK